MPLRCVVSCIVVGIVYHIQYQLACFAELHRAKAESSLCTECLVEYPTAQSPMFAIARKGKVGIVSEPGKAWVTVWTIPGHLVA